MISYFIVNMNYKSKYIQLKGEKYKKKTLKQKKKIFEKKLSEFFHFVLESSKQNKVYTVQISHC